MIDAEMRAAAERISALLRAKHLTLVTAESCTGGLVAAAITEIPGSSEVLERGFVTYSNAAKESDLGVAAEILHRFGAVSEETARAMAEGALKASTANVSVAVTGIAGPDGGSAEKPVGLVHFAAARRGGKTLHRKFRFGALGRAEVRRRSVLEALALVDQLIAAS
jgi:nicotinamide-nucleotide amidase